MLFAGAEDFEDGAVESLSGSRREVEKVLGNKRRVLFMGTPRYAADILEALTQVGDLEIRVVTKPDVAVGRRKVLSQSVVALKAHELGWEVDKPYALRDLREDWTQFSPDLIVTAAYGKILPPWVLALPRYGAFNLHASLLPRWRGPNPIAWAIRSGDEVTGVTLMLMDQGVDTGPIVAADPVVIEPNDTTGSLTTRLAKVAGQLLVAQWGNLIPGPAKIHSQPQAGACHAPKFSIEDARINWSEDSQTIVRLIRSMSPDPGAYTTSQEHRIKILEASVMQGTGTVAMATLDKNHWIVGTGMGQVRIPLIQPAGRKPMTPGDYMRGQRLTSVTLL